VYFLAEFEGTFSYKKDELSGATCVDYESALALLRFDSKQEILKKACNFIMTTLHF